MNGFKLSPCTSHKNNEEEEEDAEEEERGGRGGKEKGVGEGELKCTKNIPYLALL